MIPMLYIAYVVSLTITGRSWARRVLVAPSFREILMRTATDLGLWSWAERVTCALKKINKSLSKGTLEPYIACTVVAVSHLGLFTLVTLATCNQRARRERLNYPPSTVIPEIAFGWHYDGVRGAVVWFFGWEKGIVALL